MVKDRGLALKNALKNPSMASINLYDSTRIKVKKKLRKIKTDAFRNYVSTNLSKDSNINTVWETVRKFKNRMIPKSKNE